MEMSLQKLEKRRGRYGIKRSRRRKNGKGNKRIKKRGRGIVI